ncbi:CHAT domain-containing protein [Oceaniglobus trochenteri]|uniref:CHAT domain-containing protein n=1 Tax=Oceaniglobus trochenteri TaxID=2763260 RepID=UPI001CFFF98F|nr:CHAT domain-containing protein [Oceaniglobus trochenteri]
MRILAALLCLFFGTLGLARADGPATPAALIGESFEAAQWALLSSAGAAMRQTAQRRAASDPALTALLRQRQITADRRARAEADLAALPASSGGAAIDLSGQIDALGVELATLDRRIAALAPNTTVAETRPLTIPEVQALLRPDEGLMLFFVGDDDSFVWAVTPERAAWRRVSTARADLETGVAAIRASLIQANTLRAGVRLNAGPTPRGAPFERTQASLLYFELLAPFEPILKGVRHLFTVADGPLTALPLALLITDDRLAGADSDPEALRATHWFFQRHALTTLPSVEALAALRARPAPAGEGRLSFLGFGDPSLGGAIAAPAEVTFYREGGAGVEDIRALASLPGTRRELRALARTLRAPPETLHLGLEATETAVRAAPLAQTDVIAFATHGLLSGDLRGLGEPALVLTPPDTARPGDDGLLTASEIAALDIPAEWVILSACNTAGSDGRPDAEGLSGLARAFLFAGARSLIVSHWPVRDDAAARLTTDTFTRLADHRARGRAEALQGAMQAMLDDTSDPSLAHPAAWAPFVLVGEGGS